MLDAKSPDSSLVEDPEMIRGLDGAADLEREAWEEAAYRWDKHLCSELMDSEGVWLSFASLLF